MTAYAPESFDRAKESGPPGNATGTPKDESRKDDSRDILTAFFAVTERRTPGRRYGRFVGVAKLLLLMLAGGLVALVALWPQLRKEAGLLPIGSTRIEKEDVESLRVVNAKFTGTNADGRPYTVTFDQATQTRKESDLVVLAAPKADMVLRDGSWLAVEAPSGRFQRESRVLELDGEVSLFHDSGMEMRTGGITMNLEKGTGAGYDPLHAWGPLGELRSQGFRIRKDLGVFRFFGPARVVMSAPPGAQQ